jgi:hypothetical protein
MGRIKYWRTVVLVLATSVALLAVAKGSKMLKICLFSPVKGVVVHKGKPVVGAILERSWKWHLKNSGSSCVDQAATDDSGHFSFPAVYSWLGVVQLIPHQPVIEQLITIKHEGTEYKAWGHTKMDYDEFGELSIAHDLGQSPGLNGKPIDLYCDLDAEKKNRGGYGGIAELRN